MDQEKFKRALEIQLTIDFMKKANVSVFIALEESLKRPASVDEDALEGLKIDLVKSLDEVFQKHIKICQKAFECI